MRIIKNKVLWLVFFGLIIILSLTFWLGKAYTSKETQVSRIILAIKNNQEKVLKDRIVIKHQQFNPKTNSFKPLVHYYQEKPYELKKLKNQLLGKSHDYNYNYDLVKKGHSLMFFPKYRLQVAPITPTIRSNVSEAEVKINGKNVGQTNRQQIYQSKPMMPGLYRVSVSAHLRKQLLTETKDFDWNNRAYEEADLPLKISSFIIRGYPNATVLINGEKVGKLNNRGLFSVKGYPINSKTLVQLKLQSSNKSFTSKPYTVQMRNNGKYIQPEFNGIASFEDADNLIGNIWSGLNGNIKTPKEAEENNYDDYFVDGIKNKSFINLMKVVDRYEKDKDIANFFYDTKVISVTPFKKNKTKVKYHTNVIITPTHNRPNKLKKVAYEAVIKTVDNTSENKILENKRLGTISQHIYQTDAVSKLRKFK
ncbi:hypothetical protein GSH19_03495 [Lactobacillus sp. S2-2]|uniref:TcaA 3rd/4th domain-containing protein n=1 Tax=Lactobacillus sp. S2-2 TaxID=2692917 RepID=UPI001F185970|nr:hypothetical protein [Lactobacillus sp. S2-2]MCF6515218.1 hypothetical protein [Lactobacillus sp. S2-2]